MTGSTMTRALGNIPVGTKVDRDMREFVEEEADRLGVSVSEFLRRVLITYRESRAEQLHCDNCGYPAVIELTYA